MVFSLPLCSLACNFSMLNAMAYSRIAVKSGLDLFLGYTAPWAIMAVATFRKPAMLAPST